MVTAARSRRNTMNTATESEKNASAKTRPHAKKAKTSKKARLVKAPGPSCVWADTSDCSLCLTFGLIGSGRA